MPKISGDPELLQQVFLNIILNGVQAMQGGGELAIKTKAELTPDYVLHRMGHAEDKEDLPNHPEASHEALAVYITDTGKGINVENLDKIFNPFFTTRQQGTGLGLSITQKIVEQHGGGISVDSTPGNGTTFIIYLPAAKEGFPALTG
jgi:signal transduction histidine kinase